MAGEGREGGMGQERDSGQALEFLTISPTEVWGVGGDFNLKLPGQTLMRMDKPPSLFQPALADAQSLAVGRDNQFIEPAHLLLAMIDAEGSGVRPLLVKAGVDAAKLRGALNAILDGLPKVEGTGGDVQVSNDLGRLLNVTDKLAQKRGDQFISSELFVLAAFEDKGPLGKALKDSGASRAVLEKAIDEVRGGEKVEDAAAEENRQA